MHLVLQCLVLLNIFIPERNLPIELGVTQTLGEKGAFLVNILIDTIMWFLFINLDYIIYKKIHMKKFLIFLTLSPFLWLIGSYLWDIFRLFMSNNFTLDLWAADCTGTGYPIAKNTCSTRELYPTLYLNLSFWFLITIFIWSIVNKRSKR